MLMILIGALAAFLLHLGFMKYAARQAVPLWAVALIIVALIYATLGMLSGNYEAMQREAIGLAVFTLFAYAGMRHSVLILALGWLGHVYWDYYVDVGAIDLAPDWYAQLCVGFDVMVALVLLRLYRQSQLHLKKPGN